ncbi:hypothetical protein BZG36_01985 [Bifiguratus adelaidae]|uniref:Major facilitator superfamily (MFS) profile domain-containing protein n=1 Tax=Bifiguratus adelaidae TaxID=1938954 RepID=A0A261Y472_9FUNG|nr:hypothetical protein BZG36_01985 [Bifiguratus adelaidae]
MSDGGFGVLLPSIKSYYAVSDGVVSALLMCNTAGFLVSAFLNGNIVDHLGQKTSLVLGVCAQDLAYMLLLWRAPFPAQCCFMVILGFGLGLVNAGTNVICVTLPKSLILLNMLHASYGLGALIGPLLASALLNNGRSWNYFYVCLVCFSFSALTALLSVFTIKPGPIVGREEAKSRIKLWRTKRGGGEPEVAMAGRSTAVALNEPKSSLLRRALNYPVTPIAAVYLLFYVGVEVSLGTWAYSYLTEYRHGNPVQMAHTVSGYWGGLMAGRVLLGWFTARFGERIMVLIYLGVIAGGTLVIWLVNNSIADGIVLFFTGFVLGPLYPTTVSLTSSLIPTYLFATAVGFIAAFGSGGGALFPFATGLMANRFGIWVLMPFMICMTVGMIALWASIPKKKGDPDASGPEHHGEENQQ